ncbi:MAG: FAD-dependent oxidoreductase [Clostridia bacterium]|nr:FAD-dependent oxidoreductase [Clostridia bacterium]
MINSIWQKETRQPPFCELKGDLKTDVLIIGAGIAGVLCAYFLEREGVDYALVEAGEVCCGITKNTTAKITWQHSLIYGKLIRQFGTEKAHLYYKANEEAVISYRKLCENISCDFEEKDAFVYSLDRRDKLEEELSALDKIGAKADFRESIELPFDIAGAIRFKNQAQFNPLKFISTICKSLKIYQNTKVLEYNGEFFKTNGGRIYAKKAIVATHFPIFNKHGSYFLKLYQHRSYVIAYKNTERINGMYLDENEKGFSFREYNDMLIIGGGSHRTGKKGGNWKEISDFANKYYPTATEVCRWATQDCMTLDGVPYIGEYSNNTNDLYVATGFNKWGMTSSMVAARLLFDLVLERNNQYTELFSPSRSILRPQLLINAFESTLNLITPTTPRCPHLGCALKWNKYERSWDCPCHGSRFSEKGQLIDNPATDDLKR